ncbi:hypothetical protein ACQEPB_00320 [Novosphingobium fluoreni]|uniref:hypothetical protein n=1 Tax=Novosphingobium fluoreni TaxID=1391222 RepID=UPI003DA04785
MSAPDPHSAPVDGFSVLVDFACIAAMIALGTAILFIVNLVIASLIDGHPDLVAFMLQPWVAPAIVLLGFAVLAGVAWLLVMAREGLK